MSMSFEELQVLQWAIEEGRRIYGTYDELAKQIGCKAQHMSEYRTGERKVSFEQACRFQMATNIPFWHLRPDLKNLGQQFTEHCIAQNNLMKNSEKESMLLPFWKWCDELEITTIVIGKRRHPTRDRIEHVMQSMKDVGQQSPIVVTHDGRLVLGEARLIAARQLGYKSIKAIVLNVRKLWEQRRRLTEVEHVFTVIERYQIADYLYRYCRHWHKNIHPPVHDELYFSSSKDLYFYNMWSKGSSEQYNRVDDYIGFLTGLGRRVNYVRLRRITHNGCSPLLKLLEENLITIFLAYRISRLPASYQESLLMLNDCEKIRARLDQLESKLQQRKFINQQSTEEVHHGSNSNR